MGVGVATGGLGGAVAALGYAVVFSKSGQLIRFMEKKATDQLPESLRETKAVQYTSGAVRTLTQATVIAATSSSGSMLVSTIKSAAGLVGGQLAATGSDMAMDELGVAKDSAVRHVSNGAFGFAGGYAASQAVDAVINYATKIIPVETTTSPNSNDNPDVVVDDEGNDFIGVPEYPEVKQHVESANLKEGLVPKRMVARELLSLEGGIPESVQLKASSSNPKPVHRVPRQAPIPTPNPNCNYTTINQTFVEPPVYDLPTVPCRVFPNEINGVGYVSSHFNEAYQVKNAKNTLCKIAQLGGVTIFTHNNPDCYQRVRCENGQYYGVRISGCSLEDRVTCTSLANLYENASSIGTQCSFNPNLRFCLKATAPDPVNIIKPSITHTSQVLQSTCSEPIHTPTGFPIVKCNNLTLATYNGHTIGVGELSNISNYEAYAAHNAQHTKCKIVYSILTYLSANQGNCVEQVKCSNSPDYGIRKTCDDARVCSFGDTPEFEDFPRTACQQDGTPFCLPPQEVIDGTTQPLPQYTPPPVIDITRTSDSYISQTLLPQATKTLLPEPSLTVQDSGNDIEAGAIAGGVIGSIAGVVVTIVFVGGAITCYIKREAIAQLVKRYRKQGIDITEQQAREKIEGVAISIAKQTHPDIFEQQGEGHQGVSAVYNSSQQTVTITQKQLEEGIDTEPSKAAETAPTTP
ncbi:hypothetical protein D5018_20675 [Parashewanella curva]|uniref:Uncharacterized protein n=1 Tax=Parashewanella curva TaxID=2338552 RepID=A0A3L8PT82_9GAMM|nr:hypothetical protein [Parashewanella curva]RLV57793.1 hypothetical protein D5018_20675 [Parashewanella curva]